MYIGFLIQSFSFLSATYVFFFRHFDKDIWKTDQEKIFLSMKAMSIWTKTNSLTPVLENNVEEAISNCRFEKALFIASFHLTSFDTWSFYRGGLQGEEDRPWAKIRALLNYAGCNVSQVTLLDLDSQDESGIYICS